MIYPANTQLNMECGGSFDGVIALFTDQAQTIPLNLTAFTTAAMQINKPTSSPELLITQATGLALGGAAGTITITLTAAQLAAFTASGTFPYSISVNDGTHNYFVASGSIVFTSPIGN